MNKITNPFNLSGKRALVTGASGFIGSRLCRRLYNDGAEVHAVTRSTQSSYDTHVQWWQGELADIEVVRRLLTTIRPDLIFHLASYVSGSRDLEIVLPTFKSNLMSTVNLLTAATEIGCHRIILTGSLEEPDSSTAEAVPCSPYAAAKWASSAYARMFLALYKTPVVVARLFMVYGPGQKDLRKLIPYVTLSFLREQPAKLSSGQRQVDWIYVDDVIEGFIAIAQTPDMEGNVIDLGSGTLVSIRAVVEHLFNLINPKIIPSFGALNDRPMEQVRVANTADTFAKIGWRPTISLEKGLALTVDWYRNYFVNSERKDSEKKD